MEAADSVKEGETESRASTAPLQERDIVRTRCPPVAAVTIEELRSKLSRLKAARLSLPGAANVPPPGVVAPVPVVAQVACTKIKQGSLRTRGFFGLVSRGDHEHDGRANAGADTDAHT